MTSLPDNTKNKGRHGWLALVALAMGSFVLLGYVLWSAHEEIWEDARQTSSNYAELVEARFDATLRRIDADLYGIASRIPSESLLEKYVPRFRAEIELELERRRIEFPEIAGFQVADAAGNMLYKAGDGKYANLEDRDYFITLRDQQGQQAVFSGVIRSRVSGKDVMVVARAIYDAEGTFRGMVSAPLDLEYFDRIFASIQLGPNGAIAIRRADNHTLMMRRPFVASEINVPLNPDHPVRAAVANNNIGSLHFQAQADAIERIYSYRVLKNHPFYVIAGLARKDVTAAWRERAKTVGGIGLALFGALAILFYWLFKLQAREVLATERLRQQQQQLREAQRVARVGSWEFDQLKRHMHWSDEVFQILEVSPEEEACFTLFLSVVHPDDRLAVAEASREALQKKKPFQMEHRLTMRDGRIKHILVCAETIYNSTGEPQRTIGSMQDLTSLRQMEAQMQLLVSAFQHSGEAILITDRENLIVTVNPAFTTLTGYSAEEAIGRNPGFLSAGRSNKADYELVWECINERGFWQGEIWDRRKDGAIYPKWMSVSVIRDDAGEIRYHVSHFSDVSVERAVEAQLQHIAHHDVLTGLLNRHSLKGRLDQGLAAARREGGRLALLFIDLDRFKVINDTLGHHVGDELLIEVARRLQESVRDSDVVARLGGDEFVIMLTGVEHTTSIAMVAEKLVLSIGDPYLIEGHDLYTSPSIGIAIYPMDGEDGETLMKNADAAMYHAKAAGRNNFQYFDRRMNDAAVERLQIEHSLRQALSNDEFCLHFQPVINVKTGRVSSVEALIRWNHPEQGMIPPVRFIPVAEETGLIQPIGEWVFWTACRQLSEFAAAGLTDVKMGINISAMQMRNDNLPILAKGAIEAMGLNPRSLIFEITESVAMQRPDETVRILGTLHDMGISISIDDFGTGYSSLSYLKMFPIDHIKLDRSFVIEIDEGEDDATICDATISLTHALGLKLVAEGVETEAQLDYLRKRKCDLVQGYLFSRPLPAGQVMEYIKARNQSN